MSARFVRILNDLCTYMQCMQMNASQKEKTNYHNHNNN